MADRGGCRWAALSGCSRASSHSCIVNEQRRRGAVKNGTGLVTEGQVELT